MVRGMLPSEEGGGHVSAEGGKPTKVGTVLRREGGDGVKKIISRGWQVETQAEQARVRWEKIGPDFVGGALGKGISS